MTALHVLADLIGVPLIIAVVTWICRNIGPTRG